MLKSNYLFIYLLVLLCLQVSNAQEISTVYGTISDKHSPLPGVKIAIEGEPSHTFTDINGHYNLTIPAGNQTIKVNFITYIEQKKEITVYKSTPLKLDFQLESANGIDEQFSLGSRSAPRSSLETTVPVDVISPEDITNSNQIELTNILNYLTPSFNSNNQTISDGTDHIDPISLRGLGPDQVLILINGKRRHTSSLLNVNGTVGRGTVGTDLNAIPTSAIERIEILRDGATSQYGSDAIAGVINIILKKQTKDINIDLRTLKNTEGDGETNFASANFGIKIKEKGFINVTAEYRTRNLTNRAGNFTGAVFSNNKIEDQRLITENNFFEQTGFNEQQTLAVGPAETENISIAINTEIPINDTNKIYAFALRNYRQGKSTGFFRFPIESDRVVPSLFPNGFSPSIETDIQDDAISIGFSGIKNYWDINFSHTIGINRLDFSTSNTNNASLGESSATSFNNGGYYYQQNNTNFDISRNFDYLNGVNVAFGGEVRIENYRITAGEIDSFIDGGATFISESGEELPKIAGAQVFPGIQPENELNEFRTNTSGYLEIEAKINNELLIKGAARYENYSDFGAETVWKIASRYKIKDFINFRLGFSTGYRAPSLHQVFFNNISTQIENGVTRQVGTFNNGSAQAKEFGIETLKPELSKHFTLGFTSRIKNNLSFTFDYYNIKIKDRIVLSGTLNQINDMRVSDAQFLTNAIDTKTFGADGVLVYNTKLFNRKLTTSLAANINKTKLDGPVNTPNTSTSNLSSFFNREEIARIETAHPEFKITSILDYQINKLELNLNNTFFGSVTYKNSNEDNIEVFELNTFTGRIESRDQTFSPKVITNLSASYNILDNLKFSITGANIFNIFPDKISHSANTEQGNFIFSRREQQFGILGSNYSFKLLLKL